MTREQKDRLAAAVLSEVGNLFEFWSEKAGEHNLGDLDPDEAGQVVAQWLARLPGSSWSRFLPQPRR
jgi:hypothetical protein